MTHAKDQHFVPQFMLRYFQSKEHYIWAYDKHFNKIEERSISKVAFKKFFYDLNEGEAEGSLEGNLSKIETAAAPIIEKIIKARSVDILSEDDKGKMALFLAVQNARTITAQNDIQDFQKQFRMQINDFIKEMLGDADLLPDNTRELWRDNIEDKADEANVLLRKRWAILESDNEFYTSDHPLVKFNEFKREGRGHLGLDSFGIQLFLPLTPSILLAIVCEKMPGLIPKNFKCGAETVEHLNSLQVRYAERFVFSSKSDFWLVEDMLLK